MASKFKLPNPFSIISDVKNAVENKTNELMAGFDPYNMDESDVDRKIEEIEGQLKPVSDAMNTLDTVSKVMRAVKDPIGSAKDLAKDAAINALMNSDKVQELKNSLLEKAEEKIKDIPEVQKFVDNVNEKVSDISGVDIPSEILNVLNDPESLSEEIPETKSFIAKTIAQSGVTKQLRSLIR